MSIEVRRAGGTWVSNPSNIGEYSVREAATPLNIASSLGAVGDMDFTITPSESEPQDALFLLGDEIELEDGSNGSTRSTVSIVEIRDGRATITADSRTAMLVASRDVQPFDGTLGDALEYYYGLVGITGGYYTDPAIASRHVTYPGWTGDVWNGLKQICAIEQIEINQVSSLIVARPVRLRELDIVRQSAESTRAENDTLSRNVTIRWRAGDYVADTQRVYPVHRLDEPQPYQVDASSILVFETEVDMSMEIVHQPSAVVSVPQDYNGAISIYSVIDRESNPYDPSLWEARGGYVKVEILPDTYTLRVTIRGADDSARGPFRLAARLNADDSTDTSTRTTLYIAAAGVVAVPMELTVPTSAPDEKTSRESTATIDSPFIKNMEDAFDAAAIAASAAASPRQTISATATVVNRRGDSGEVMYASFAVFDTLYAGQTFANFDTAWTSATFADFDASMLSLVKDDFENQAFGNVAGARVRKGWSWYRVTNATITQENISYQAESDTTFGDFDAEWTGQTFADFDAAWAGFTFDEFAVAPLRGA